MKVIGDARNRSSDNGLKLWSVNRNDVEEHRELLTYHVKRDEENRHGDSDENARELE